MQTKHPFYIRSTIILLGLVLLVYVLASLREILIPLAFALLLSVLLNPLVNRFEKQKFPKVVAIIISLLLAIVFMVGLIYFLSSQLTGFSNELPVLKQKSVDLFISAQQMATNKLGLSSAKQQQLLHEAENGLQAFLGHSLTTVVGSLTLIFLVPVYSFLFLYYKNLLLNFLYEVFAEKNAGEVSIVLQQTKTAVQSYMVGLLIEGIIVATLNAMALLILGVKYAVLLGVIGAILNVLPYIGGIIAIALPVLMATITKNGYHTQLGIIIAYLIIQFIDNHFLIPWIVSSKVKINALISIVGVLLAGALWGISGMFLSIPFIGILKIVFDRIDELKPWGKLLGDEVPTRLEGSMWAKARRKALTMVQYKRGTHS